ncbi:MAG: hypothetical protein Fur0035_18520 [Anaerolineales bacterium]
MDILTVKKKVLKIKRQELGVYLVIFVFVLSQFVEINLFSVGETLVSLQKVLAILCYPAAVLLMGRLKIKPVLVVFTLFLWAAFVLALFLSGDIGAILSASVIVMVGFFGSIVVYTALSVNLIAGMRYLASLWIKFSLLSSVVAVLQAIGRFPLLTVSDDLQNMRDVTTGYFRGVGFKFDPNFLALMLALAVPFILAYVPKWHIRLFDLLVVFAGILATFSRMGLLLAGMSFVMFILLNAKKKSSLRVMFLGFAIVSMAAIAIFLSAETVRTYVVSRILDVTDFFYVLFTGDVPTGWFSSAAARAILLRAAFQSAVENWLTGVGAFQTQKTIGDVSGLENVSHNTYVEIFLIGGITGIFALLIYLFTLMSINLKLRKLKTDGIQTVILINWVIIFAGIFLSLAYNSVFWFPLSLSLATQSVRNKPGVAS